MGPLAAWSRSDREGAITALRSIASATGVVQLDVDERNFMRNARGVVVAIDLEETSHVESEAQTEPYLARARQVLGVHR